MFAGATVRKFGHCSEGKGVVERLLPTGLGPKLTCLYHFEPENQECHMLGN